MSDNPLALSAEQILKIPTLSPERIFTQTDIKKQLGRLRKRWHPDTTKFPFETKDVFYHISQLYDEAEKRLESGTWKGKSEITFKSKMGKTFRFPYRTMHVIELGKMYISKKHIMYVIDDAYEDLFDNGLKQIKDIRYPKKLEKEFKKYFPKIKFSDKKTSIGIVVVFEKPEGTVLLQDLLDYMPDNRLDPLHVAWVGSSIYNIATFLDHVGICHNSIITTAIFVDPDNHASYLFGGWWYAKKPNEKLIAVPGELLKTLPKEVFDTKKAKTIYDRKAVKGVAIACLGDSSMIGMKLLSRKDVPKPMLSWVRAPSGTDAIEEFDGWYKTLEKCFGKRKFIKLDVDVDDIY